MKTRFETTKVFQVLGLIVVCAFNLSSPHAVISVFAETSEKIVFIIDDGQRDIYTMNPDGSNLTNVTNTPELQETFPRWSPDATKISFSCDGDIWIMNRDGSNRINLTQTPGFQEETHSWSPDGSEIVYSRRLGLSRDERIYVMDVDGTYHAELTTGHMDGHPCWSPDGTRIAFQRALAPGKPISRWQIYVMKTDETDVDRITYTEDDDINPAWSPDGTRILFTSSRGENYYRNQIFVGDFNIGPDGIPQLLNQTNITNNEWRHGCPRWSPDGNQIVYFRAPYGTHDHDIWISNADGSGLVQLTNTPGITDSYPDWATVNQPPVADAGSDQTVEQESYDGTEITLDGSGSTDPDSTEGTNDDIVSFEWYEGMTLLGNGEVIDYTFPLGEHIVTLVVTDSQGETDNDEVIITVVDTTPPMIYDVVAAPDVLWPPNHKMVEVFVEMYATDICDPTPFYYILWITSNEPINGPGDGSTEPDWILFDNEPLVVLLRAERAGGGDGRVYTILVVCEDASGNISTETVDVIVPHDQGKGKKK